MIRAPKNFNGTFISRHFFPSFFKHNSLKTINSGYCYDWAYFAHRLFGAQLWATDFHAWVQVHNHDPKEAGWIQRFFDSETHKGVSNFMQLGCNIRNSYPLPWGEHAPKAMELKEFKDFWNEHGGGHRRHWDSMLEPKLQTVLGKRFSKLTPIFHPRTTP
jgi:hypothetical protein